MHVCDRAGQVDYAALGTGGCWIIDEPELHPSEDILVSGVTGPRGERIPNFPDTA